MNDILTGLIVSAGQVNDGTALHVSDLVSFAGLDFWHGKSVVEWWESKRRRSDFMYPGGNKGVVWRHASRE